MHVTFADEAVLKLCTTRASMVRAFGEFWTSVKLCLTVLMAVETLADIAAFAAFTVRCIGRTVTNAVDFLVRHGDISVTLRAMDREVRGAADEEATALVRAVTVMSVSLTPAVAVRG